MPLIKNASRLFVSVILLLSGANFAARAQTALIPSDVTWSGSGEVEVPLKVTNYDKITGVQFTLKWDPAVLSLVTQEGWPPEPRIPRPVSERLSERPVSGRPSSETAEP